MFVPAQPDRDFPDWYRPAQYPQKHLASAGILINHVASLGMEPIAATVTGSRLRGVESNSSDTDALVLVKDVPRRAWRTIEPFLPGIEPEEHVQVQVQSLKGFVSRISTSVPYVEVLNSPYLVVDENWLSFLRALRPNMSEFAVHAESFVAHIFKRDSASQFPAKQVRNALAAWTVLNTLSPLMDRDRVTFETMDPAAREWIFGVADKFDVDVPCP